MTGIATAAMAQGQTQETEKPGFFKQAFRDMKDMYSTEGITAFVNYLIEDYLHLWSAARKKADFMAGKVFSRSPAKIRGDFLAGSVADKKETPVKDVSVSVW